jgi:sugar lactone lactonase YvrE
MKTMRPNVTMAATIAVLAGFLPTTNAFADTFYVSLQNTGSGVIEQYTSGGASSVFATLAFGTPEGGTPQGMAFDSSGNLYVATANDTIVKFTPAGIGSVFASTGLSDPQGLAFDSSGNLYAANMGNSTIEKFTPSGSASVFANTGLDDPFDLAFDSSGNLYASNFANNTIEKFTPSGSASVFIANTSWNDQYGQSAPTGIAFDTSGDLYVANFNAFNKVISEFTPTGVPSVFGNTGLDDPQGIAFDSSGNLFAVNFSGYTIEQFSPSGSGSLFVSIPRGQPPSFIAIAPSPVPEPSTWALLLFAGSALAFLRPEARKL